MDLTAQAVRARGLVEDAIATSGTVVTISRDPDDLDGTVNFGTLAVTDPTPTGTVATGVAAIISAQGEAPTVTGTDRTEHPTAFRVLLPIAVTDVREGDLVTVTASHDTRLTGAELLVAAVLDDALGIVRQVIARRR